MVAAISHNPLTSLWMPRLIFVANFYGFLYSLIVKSELSIDFTALVDRSGAYVYRNDTGSSCY
jgi:hypothetical protein